MAVCRMSLCTVVKVAKKNFLIVLHHVTIYVRGVWRYMCVAYATVWRYVCAACGDIARSRVTI